MREWLFDPQATRAEIQAICDATPAHENLRVVMSTGLGTCCLVYAETGSDIVSVLTRATARPQDCADVASILVSRRHPTGLFFTAQSCLSVARIVGQHPSKCPSMNLELLPLLDEVLNYPQVQLGCWVCTPSSPPPGIRGFVTGTTDVQEQVEVTGVVLGTGTIQKVWVDVKSVRRWRSQPMDEEMEMFITYFRYRGSNIAWVQAQSNLHHFTRRSFVEGGRVKIVDGPLMGHVMTVLQIPPSGPIPGTIDGKSAVGIPVHYLQASPQAMDRVVFSVDGEEMRGWMVKRDEYSNLVVYGEDTGDYMHLNPLRVRFCRR
ncbi:hypothetical protein DFP72DRAFT_1077666 [Ephemerocybe angulata]|uniref:Uncharacterized protein n=1 Tax=Ephemerocybe angulata TaxID=980116 RepID=A0A8H6HGI1_9AGAR|nr:hypothetical protein DFP72DRAFT_1077666 [Tulosesus angulatus]